MLELTRRGLLEWAAAAVGAGLPLRGREASQAGAEPASTADVRMTGDGRELDPDETAAALARLASGPGVIADEYGLGGVVSECEAWFARLLGKERALFMPSGTLANHIAIRSLARERRRVIVQDVSHVYNDTGDACQVLSGLNLVPLAPGRATLGWLEIERVLERTASGRVDQRVGAISIESPVRRLRGETVDFEELRRVCAAARARGIGLHLDGARLFVASAYSGRPPAEYAALFDTVYVSLWKCFNSATGAVLAGPAAALDGLHHVRRMFGGALWSFWPMALLARHFAEGFVERLAAAVSVCEAFLRLLESDARFAVERVANGTNVVGLLVRSGDAGAFRRRLEADGVRLPEGSPVPEGARFLLHVNETWNGTTAAALAQLFRRAADRAA